MEEDTKPFWLSRRFWGAVIAFIGIVMPMLGYGDTAEINRVGGAWMNFIDAGLQLFGLAVAFYGGITATKRLTLRRSSS